MTRLSSTRASGGPGVLASRVTSRESPCGRRGAAQDRADCRRSSPPTLSSWGSTSAPSTKWCWSRPHRPSPRRSSVWGAPVTRVGEESRGRCLPLVRAGSSGCGVSWREGFIEQDIEEVQPIDGASRRPGPGRRVDGRGRAVGRRRAVRFRSHGVSLPATQPTAVRSGVGDASRAIRRIAGSASSDPRLTDRSSRSELYGPGPVHGQADLHIWRHDPRPGLLPSRAQRFGKAKTGRARRGVRLGALYR